MNQFAKILVRGGRLIAATLLVMLAAGIVVGFEFTEPTSKSVSLFGVMAAITGAAMLGLRLAGVGCACKRNR